MKKSRLIFSIIAVVVLGSLLSSCIGAGAATTVQIWPGFTISEDGQTGYVASGNRVYAIDLNNGTQKWRFPETPERNVGFSAPPALKKDGQLIVGGYNKILYSIDVQSGQQKWTNQDATNRYYGGGLATDQTTFAPNIDSNLYAVNSAGSLVWKFPTGNALWSAPVTDGKLIYLASMDHKLYALDPTTGKATWQTESLGGSIPSSPLLADGKLYSGNFGNMLVAIDAANGKTLWSFPTSGWVYATPVLDNGTLYFGDLDGKFYAVDSTTGKSKWPNPAQPDTSINRAISGAAAVAGDTVYFNSKAGVIYALDTATGTVRWNSMDKPCCSNAGKSTLGKLYGPVQVNGDTLYVSPMGTSPLVVAIDLNGNSKWSFTPAK